MGLTLYIPLLLVSHLHCPREISPVWPLRLQWHAALWLGTWSDLATARGNMGDLTKKNAVSTHRNGDLANFSHGDSTKKRLVMFSIGNHPGGWSFWPIHGGCTVWSPNHCFDEIWLGNPLESSHGLYFQLLNGLTHSWPPAYTYHQTNDLGFWLGLLHR